jgi:hypothetical protein
MSVVIDLHSDFALDDQSMIARDLGFHRSPVALMAAT